MKRYTLLYIILFFSCFGTYIKAQDEESEDIYYEDFNYESHKEIGLNFTQFISQFIPLNIQNTKDGPIGYSYKGYTETGIAFRFGFGANINSNFENSFLSMRMGYERRKPLAKKVYYTRGWDVLAVVGTFNFPNNGLVEEQALLGLGPVIGLEYHLTNALLITTESMLFVGVSSEDGFNINILPPTALFLHFRF